MSSILTFKCIVREDSAKINYFLMSTNTGRPTFGHSAAEQTMFPHLGTASLQHANTK